VINDRSYEVLEFGKLENELPKGIRNAIFVAPKNYIIGKRDEFYNALEKLDRNNT
jgi:hypothetical protein